MAFNISEFGKPVTFHSGQIIYDADFLVGDPSIFFIMDGEVDIVKRYTPLQKEQFAYKKGDLFGMLEVYTGTPRVTQAVAVKDTQAVGFTRADFERAMVANLGFAVLAIRILSRMLRQMNDRIKKLG
ncbi:MAG: Crp/Fnr family transcriptional regulator [Spirochaetia bacterium]|nr:Crp/Fnr family transcriptional regulator [Spirochaetia bacterium]